MSSRIICKTCGHRFKGRKRKWYSGSNHPMWPRRCSKCRGYHFIHLTDKEIDMLIMEAFENRIRKTRSDKYKEVRGILKDQRAAAKVEPQVSKMVPLDDQEKEPGPQYPECFGDANQFRNKKECTFNCMVEDECEEYIKSRK